MSVAEDDVENGLADSNYLAHDSNSFSVAKLRISERNAKQKRKIFERKDSKLVSLASSKKF